MAIQTFRPGDLYASRSQVRAAFREYWKGILVREDRVAIIVAYKGLARRVHYGDVLSTKRVALTYIGEGLRGDQKLTRGNAALVDAWRSSTPVDVFFDCGDIQLPVGRERKFEKHLVGGGRWLVVDASHLRAATEARLVWCFKLIPEDHETRVSMEVVFGGESLDAFEEVFPDLDAIQTRTGKRFAVKTITKIPQRRATSGARSIRYAIGSTLSSSFTSTPLTSN